MNHQERLTAYISAFVGELVTSGVKDVVISPGSRSTPIALVMAEHPELRLHIHVDERSAAFFALGIAKATGDPVAILCTSGTAAANYYPAIVEANISRVPLIVLTADRPHELRDVGAPQAIDQIHLYGHQVKWFMEMAPPDGTDEMIRYARTICARAAATALQYPAGPVHLNFPIREPLIPQLDDAELFKRNERGDGYVNIFQGELAPTEEMLDKVIEQVTSSTNGVIVCGPIDDVKFVDAVTELARKLKYPILADPLSQLRSGDHEQQYIVDTYNSFLRYEEVKQWLKPDLVIRFGSMPVSKPLTIFMKENRNAKQMVIDGGNGWRDPLTSASEMVYCKESRFCIELSKSFEERSDTAYLEKWLSLNQWTKAKLTEIRDITELSEGKFFHLLADMLPEQSTLFVGNSMPIRDLDSFFLNNGKGIRVMGNRGANGIDGIVSTALGAATVSKPMYLVVGDLTFFHDLNGLLAAKLYQLDVTIIVLNNNGGGIFSFLPQADHPKHFEQLFGTPLDLDFRHVVEMYQGTYVKIKNWDHCRQVLTETHEPKGLRVLEMMTNRDRNLSEHRNLEDSVSREIVGFLKDVENEA